MTTGAPMIRRWWERRCLRWSYSVEMVGAYLAQFCGDPPYCVEQHVSWANECQRKLDVLSIQR